MPAPEGNDNALGNAGGGAPEGNQNALGNGGGAPTENANAMTHGRDMSGEDLRETFSEEERAMHAALMRDFREEFPGGSEDRADRTATAAVMFDRLTVELLDTGLNRTGTAPDGEEYDSLDTAKLDALMAYHRDLRAIEESAREERRERREREEKEMLAVLVGGEENLDVDRDTPAWASEDETEPEAPEGPATPNEPVSPPAAGENGILTRTALADGSREPTDAETSADADEEDTDGEDESSFRVPRYVEMAYRDR